LSDSKLKVSDEQRAEIQKQEALRLSEQTARESKSIQLVSAIVVTVVALGATVYSFRSVSTWGISGLTLILAIAGLYLSIGLNRTRSNRTSIKQAFSRGQFYLVIGAFLLAGTGPNLRLLIPYHDSGAECNDIVFCASSVFAYWLVMFIVGVISIMASLVLTAVAGGRLLAKLNIAIIESKRQSDLGVEQPKEFQEPK